MIKKKCESSHIITSSQFLLGVNFFYFFFLLHITVCMWDCNRTWKVQYYGSTYQASRAVVMKGGRGKRPRLDIYLKSGYGTTGEAEWESDFDVWGGHLSRTKATMMQSCIKEVLRISLVLSIIFLLSPPYPPPFYPPLLHQLFFLIRYVYAFSYF